MLESARHSCPFDRQENSGANPALGLGKIAGQAEHLQCQEHAQGAVLLGTGLVGLCPVRFDQATAKSSAA